MASRFCVEMWPSVLWIARPVEVPPRIISDSYDFRGSVWTRDNVLVDSPRPDSSLAIQIGKHLRGFKSHPIQFFHAEKRLECAVQAVRIAGLTTGVMLAISRIVAGLAAGNISAAYAYTTDITTDATRPKALGLLGSAFGMGFILGPALGGLLAGTNPDDGAGFDRIPRPEEALQECGHHRRGFGLPDNAT